jgi:hypothetical protein
MRNSMRCSRTVRLFGYIVLACWASSVVHEIVGITVQALPLDMGIAIGNTALLLLSVLALTIASCFKKFEERLDEIQSSRS